MANSNPLHIWLACLPLLIYSNFVLASPEDTVRENIDNFHATLTSVMQMNGDFENRFNELSPVIKSLFDAPNISRISTGKFWRVQEAQSQQEFTELMYTLITATYADRFVNYNDQEFTVEAVESKGKDRWVVKSILTKSDGETVTLDYYLRAGLVFNVVANGVSDLSLKRADYASILAGDGFSGLVAHINRNILEYRQGMD